MARPKPKKYKRNRRRIGARAYKNYSEEMLTLAVEMVRNKNVTSYDAEKQFGIPRRTIEKRAKNLHTNKPGPRYRFSEEEELQFVKVLIAASEFGCPLTQLDFRLVVFDYLKKNNKADIFNGNPPGDWWVKNFLIRHHDKLTVRSTQNIKKARAEKTLQDFRIYFENLESSVEDLPATHILNYDETNVSDDPGAAKCIFRRGVKYPERIVNHSKGCISIMFSGTASGHLLAPYVVYKSENMWTQWCNGGPEGARYNRTKSGWFDSAMFMDWFTTIVIPWAQNLEGSKVVIGDNLSSHINVDVLELCERHNIRFVLLPPNSTQLTQPLDVAFFGPLKRTWRKILMKYKIENPKQTSLNKIHFPLLLKQLIEDASLNKKENLVSGFRATGIFPYNPRKVYSKIPEYCEEITQNVDKSLLDYLKENRNPNPIRRNTNKKMSVPAGKSVSSSDIKKDLTKKELRNETNYDEKLVSSDVPEKKKSKINIISDIRILPKKKENEHARKTKKEEVKAGPSGLTTKRKVQKGRPSVLKKISKTDVISKQRVITKRLYDNCSDSDSQCSVQYADSSDFDADSEDVQEYLLRQLIDDQKIEEQEFMDQMNKFKTKEDGIEKQVKETQLESLTIENDKWKRHEMKQKIVNEYEMEPDTWEEQKIEEQTIKIETKENEIEKQVKGTENHERKVQEMQTCQMVNEYEMERDSWEETAIMEQMTELETKEYELEKQKNNVFLERHTTESEEKKGQEVERQLEKIVVESDAKEKQETGQQIDRSEIKKQIKENNMEKQKIDQRVNYFSINGKESLSQEETNNEQSEKACKVKIVSVGQYVLVKFESTKNTNKYYCGLITKITEREGIFAKFMRFKNGGFYWPTVLDTSIVFQNDIMQILPNPCQNRRGILYFDVKFQYKLE